MAATPTPFEPITFNRIALPAGISGGTPAFTTDGQHLLFVGRSAADPSTPQLWRSDLSGKDAHCISCSGGPAIPANGPYVNPFPDGRRIFIGFQGVLECSPSVLDCATHYDLSPANPPGGIILPGGAATAPQTVVRQGAYPTLAPDGEHIAYSDVRTDGFEQMIVAKLVREADRYVVADPKVINPAGPRSLSDPDVAAWADSTGLMELKTFTHGGAAIAYVQGGGSASENPDVWEIDLKTGVRKRLTAHPDWDEDFAGSPDGNSFAVWSNRNTHLWDGLGGLLPFRSFIDAPMIAAEAGMLTNSPNNLGCAGVMYLFPGDGDQGGTRAGQPIIAPDAHVHTTVTGWPAWNPDGNMLAINAVKNGAGLFSGETPSFLLVAQLPARRPTKPLAVVSSDVGDWAPAPADWHPPFGYSGDVTLHGPGGGTVDIHYGGQPGAVYGSFSETYNDYSEDGRSFLNGTKSIDVTGFGVTAVHEVTHLKMTGEHTGSLDKDLAINGGNASGTPTYSGTSTVTYDGTTLTGPPAWLQSKGASCPDGAPKEPALKATATSLGADRYKVEVTASVGGLGQDETLVDTEPVKQAHLVAAGVDVYTDDSGVATVTATGDRPATVTVAAGETLAPTTVTIPAATQPPASPRPSPAPHPAPARRVSLSAIKQLRATTLRRSGLLATVRVPASGRIELRLTHSNRAWASGHRLVRKAGTYRVRIRLNAAGRKAIRALRKGHSVRLKLRIRMTIAGHRQTAAKQVTVKG